jgi:hypothetical protein
VGLLIQTTESTGNHTSTPLYRSETMRTFRSAAPLETNANFGGFPGPREVISRLLHRFLPALHRRLARTITMPRTTTITSMRRNTESARAVPYVSFDATVGPNSTFEELTEEQLEELGGVEFRALNALLWIVGTVRFKYYLLCHRTHSSFGAVSHMCAIGQLDYHRSLHINE